MKINFCIKIICFTLLYAFGLVACVRETEPFREYIEFNSDWKFIQGDVSSYKEKSYNDIMWRSVTLPHSRSVEAQQHKDHSRSNATEVFPEETVWYRKTFTLDESDTLKRIYITFDGVYRNSEIYINGHLLGKRLGGYVGFQFNLTPYITFGDKQNVIALKIDNSDKQYSKPIVKSGVVQNVWLMKTHHIHIKQWGINVTTLEVNNKKAKVEIAILLENHKKESERVGVVTELVNSENKSIAIRKNKVKVFYDTVNNVVQRFTIQAPELWSLENPKVYKAISKVYLEKKEIDSYETIFNIRFYEPDSKNDFSLDNNQTILGRACNNQVSFEPDEYN